MSGDPRGEALSVLTRFLVTETTVGDTLQRIAEITFDAVEPATAVGLTMLGEGGRPTTAVSTSPVSPEIDAAQYREDRGPCLDAWRRRRVVRVDDVEAVDHEYPAFTAACRDHRVRSTLSIPLVSGEVSMGALNLYAAEAAAFDDHAAELAFDLAGAAGAIAANVAAYLDAVELSEQLDEAMRSRAVIEQAKGVLMAQSADLDADSAFALLRDASQRENVKLRDIARRVVDHRSSAEPPAPPGGS